MRQKWHWSESRTEPHGSFGYASRECFKWQVDPVRSQVLPAKLRHTPSVLNLHFVIKRRINQVHIGASMTPCGQVSASVLRPASLSRVVSASISLRISRRYLALLPNADEAIGFRVHKPITQGGQPCVVAPFSSFLVSIFLIFHLVMQSSIYIYGPDLQSPLSLIPQWLPPSRILIIRFAAILSLDLGSLYEATKFTMAHPTSVLALPSGASSESDDFPAEPVPSASHAKYVVNPKSPSLMSRKRPKLAETITFLPSESIFGVSRLILNWTYWHHELGSLNSDQGSSGNQEGFDEGKRETKAATGPNV